VTFLEIALLDREVPLVSELIGDLSVQCALIFPLLRRSLRLDGQEHVGPLFCCELKKDGEVWSASAWISTPLRSSVLSSSYCFAKACGERAARSWELPVS
jgi:hypothetical protein